MALEVDASAAFYNVSEMPDGQRNTLDWAIRCLGSCKSACLEDPPARSVSLEVLRWDDEEDCAYRCVHSCLAECVRAGGRVYKYLGKWPHTRVLGVQVSLSRIFCSGCAWMSAPDLVSKLPRRSLSRRLSRCSTPSRTWRVSSLCAGVEGPQRNCCMPARKVAPKLVWWVWPQRLQRAARYCVHL